jgi:hypothetical protein
VIRVSCRIFTFPTDISALHNLLKDERCARFGGTSCESWAGWRSDKIGGGGKTVRIWWGRQGGREKGVGRLTNRRARRTATIAPTGRTRRGRPREGGGDLGRFLCPIIWPSESATVFTGGATPARRSIFSAVFPAALVQARAAFDTADCAEIRALLPVRLSRVPHPCRSSGRARKCFWVSGQRRRWSLFAGAAVCFSARRKSAERPTALVFSSTRTLVTPDMRH